MVLMYQLPIVIKSLFYIYLLLVSYNNFKYVWQQNVHINFTSNNMLWSITENSKKCEYYHSASCRYINAWFVWIVFSNSNGSKKGIIIGRDSLPTERFMQLRRCILNPELIQFARV